MSVQTGLGSHWGWMHMSRKCYDCMCVGVMQCVCNRVSAQCMMGVGGIYAVFKGMQCGAHEQCVWEHWLGCVGDYGMLGCGVSV